MRLSHSLFILFFTSSVLWGQNSVGLNINNDDVELQASLNLNAMAGYADGTTYTIDGNYLHTDSENLFTFGVSGENQLQGIYGMTVGFGIKAAIADDYFALPLLAKGSYRLPLNDAVPTTSLQMLLAYAPSVLSFSDADKYFEFRTQLDMEVVPNIHLFTGYRNIDTDYVGRELNFNDSFYGGLKLNF